MADVVLRLAPYAFGIAVIVGVFVARVGRRSADRVVRDLDADLARLGAASGRVTVPLRAYRRLSAEMIREIAAAHGLTSAAMDLTVHRPSLILTRPRVARR